MSDQKLTIPHWLNPDAVLGAVEYQGDDHCAIGHDTEGGMSIVGLVHCKSPYPHSYWVRVSVCKPLDKHPVKPELAALFGEGN